MNTSNRSRNRIVNIKRSNLTMFVRSIMIIFPAHNSKNPHFQENSPKKRGGTQKNKDRSMPNNHDLLYYSWTMTLLSYSGNTLQICLIAVQTPVKLCSILQPVINLIKFYNLTLVIELPQNSNNMPKTTVQNTLQKVISKGGEPQQIEKLCFDNIQIINFTIMSKNIVERCMNLEYLTLNCCMLQNLTHFPRMVKLISLELAGNSLRDKDLIEIKGCLKLNFLSLQQNLIQNIHSFNVLAKLPLEILFVEKNPLTENENYRQELFNMFTTVNMIDCLDRNGEYAISDDEQSYITDPLRSINNLDSFLSEVKLFEEESMDKVESPKRALKCDCYGKQAVINQGNRSQKKRKVQFSDDEGEDEMMISFFQKINEKKLHQ